MELKNFLLDFQLLANYFSTMSYKVLHFVYIFAMSVSRFDEIEIDP